MSHLYYKIFLILIIIVYPVLNTGAAQNFNTLNSINPAEKKIKALRQDIRKTIVTVKSKRDIKGLPDLKFYKYKIKAEDTFWKILSRTSLNIDTLSTINNLSSPGEIITGNYIYISNMRGLVYRVKENDTLEKISKDFKVPQKYIKRVNKISSLNKEYIFIPCGRLQRFERSLFLGTGFAAPLKIKYKKTSSFGHRIDPINKKRAFHKGVDLSCPVNTAVYAALKGKVIFTGYKNGYGKLVIIKHYHNYYSYYGHLNAYKVKAGETVNTRQLIALSGNTGRTTGPHLHFEIRKKNRPINPRILIK